jgi:hypothetical protein
MAFPMSGSTSSGRNKVNFLTRTPIRLQLACANWLQAIIKQTVAATTHKRPSQVSNNHRQQQGFSSVLCNADAEHVEMVWRFTSTTGTRRPAADTRHQRLHPSSPNLSAISPADWRESAHVGSNPWPGLPTPRRYSTTSPQRPAHHKTACHSATFLPQAATRYRPEPNDPCATRTHHRRSTEVRFCR